MVLDQGESGRMLALYNVSSIDFLLSTSLHRIVVGVLVVLLVERDVLYAMQELSWQQWAYIVLSCVLACIINLTATEVIRVFGAVTKAVLGHAKTMLVLAMGLVMHPPAMDVIFAKHMAGIAIALTGAIKYGQYTAFPQADCSSRCRPATTAAITPDVEAGGDSFLKMDSVHFMSMKNLIRLLIMAGSFIFVVTLTIPSPAATRFLSGTRSWHMPQ